MTRAGGSAFRRWVALASMVASMSLAACDLLPYRWDRGERLYRKECSRCHGIYGDGNAPKGLGNPWTDLTDDDFRYGGDPTSMANLIRDGVLGKMPDYDRDELSSEDLRLLVNHVFELRGDRVPYPELEP